MCGIVGIINHHGKVASQLFDSLVHLQHRGQDAAGVMTCQDKFYSKHGLGLVQEIFNADDIRLLHGRMGIAHARYPTAGGYSATDSQPLWIGHPRGIAFAHNGNLVNADALSKYLHQKNDVEFHTTLDTEVLLHLFADSMELGFDAKDEDIFFQQIEYGLKHLFTAVQGSYSVVGMIMGKGMIAFRDPHGIRPLVMGERKNENGHSDYIFASETSPFYALGFEPHGDIAPGEVVYINEAGRVQRKIITQKEFAPCVFEYVYFARPDSTLDEVSVYRSRLRMGQNLAKLWLETYPDVIPDVVIPAPSTANTAALSFAHALGVRYSEGLYKNPFIGRTFIMPDQAKRSQSVRYKLTPQRTEIENKKVLIVDDSIVRGTTSREIVKMVREFGAKEINFVSTAPPLTFPCFYGIDIPSRDELIAAKFSIDEIKRYLGVDRLLYQTQDALVEAITRRGDHHIKLPCMACMDGKYISGNITEEKMLCMSAKRMKEKA